MRDIRASRRFYERYFGFSVGPAEWVGEEVLFVRNADGFDLALMRGEHPPNPGAFHHFGFQQPDPESVRELQARLEADKVPILEVVEESDLTSFKCADPDGYTVEVYANVGSGEVTRRV